MKVKQIVILLTILLTAVPGQVLSAEKTNDIPFEESQIWEGIIGCYGLGMFPFRLLIREINGANIKAWYITGWNDATGNIADLAEFEGSFDENSTYILSPKRIIKGHPGMATINGKYDSTTNEHAGTITENSWQNSCNGGFRRVKLIRKEEKNSKAITTILDEIPELQSSPPSFADNETLSIPPELLQSASLNGSYSELLQIIECYKERAKDGQKFDFRNEEWYCGQKKKAGYAVYVRPYLYVWSRLDEERLKSFEAEIRHDEAISYKNDLLKKYEEKIESDEQLQKLNNEYHLVQAYKDCFERVRHKQGSNLTKINFDECSREINQKQHNARNETRQRQRNYKYAIDRLNYNLNLYNQNLSKEDHARKLEKYPEQQTLPDCFAQIKNEKGQNLTANDVENCIVSYNKHVAYIESQEKKIQQKIDAEKQRLREQERLAVFDDSIYLADANSPKQVRTAAARIGAEFIKTIKIGGNRVDVYDTSASNSRAPLAYATFIKQGSFLRKKEYLSSIIFWIAPKEDSLDPELMGEAGVFGLIGLGQIVNDRNKLQKKLDEKYGPPSTVDNFKFTDLTEDKVSPLAIFLSGSLSSLLSGNNNRVWIRDGGKTLLAVQNSRTLLPQLMQNLPSMYNGHESNVVTGIEFMNLEHYPKPENDSSTNF